MADIIPLNKKLERLKNKKSILARKRKIQAVQNVFRCVRCAFKCEKCGASIDLKDAAQPTEPVESTIPYNFCHHCKEEYIDYIQFLKGEKDPENYWYTHGWADLWRRWIDYQGALDNYLRSKEFKALLMEIKEIKPFDEEE
ncbi:MAG: hypothetical protein R6U50_05095 [Desulfobacterales bacterium]